MHQPYFAALPTGLDQWQNIQNDPLMNLTDNDCFRAKLFKKAISLIVLKFGNAAISSNCCLNASKTGSLSLNSPINSLLTDTVFLFELVIRDDLVCESSIILRCFDNFGP